jgi:hypothetical protein
MDMGNFFSWVATPLNNDDVDTWFRINNMISEKRELFCDLCVGLTDIIETTYLGGERDENNETKVLLTNEEQSNHFDWCWKKILENFENENIHISEDGEHKVFLKNFFTEIFYKQKNQKVVDGLRKFFIQLFDDRKPFTKSDLDMLTELYKSIDKNLLINKQ